VLLVGAAVLVLVTVGITLLGGLVQRTSGSLGEAIGLGPGALAGGLVHAASFVLSVLVVLLLYRFVPARGLRVRDGLAGAIVTALLFRLISLASGWIYERMDGLSVVYGSLTTALVFLYAMYLYSCALLLGAEFAAAWARPPAASREPLLVQLRRAVLGLFVTPEPPPAEETLAPGPEGKTSRKRIDAT
jgi:YihY family inner membrane protein